MVAMLDSPLGFSTADTERYQELAIFANNSLVLPHGVGSPIPLGPPLQEQTFFSRWRGAGPLKDALGFGKAPLPPIPLGNPAFLCMIARQF